MESRPFCPVEEVRGGIAFGDRSRSDMMARSGWDRYGDISEGSCC